MIADIVPGGLDAFQNMKEEEQLDWRQRAIHEIGRQCRASRKAAVVAGHFMFWNEEQEAEQPVCTQNDLDTFTHILYLDVRAELINTRRQEDTRDKRRERQTPSVAHLRRWQETKRLSCAFFAASTVFCFRS